MLFLTFCIVVQIVAILVFNSLRKRLLKNLTRKNVARLYKAAMRMALDFAGSLLSSKRH